MRRDAFERKLLDLWMTTRVPLTRTHIQYVTRASRKKMELWLDELVREDVLEMVVGNDGEVRWKVNGASRPLDGPVTIEEMERGGQASASEGALEHLGELQGAARAALAARSVSSELRRERRAGEKSYLWSTGLSFFFGPLGWLYAGGLREAIPASLAMVLLTWILPSFLLGPLLGVAMPVSAVVGFVYAWKYNRAGERRNILNWDAAREPKRLGHD